MKANRKALELIYGKVDFNTFMGVLKELEQEETERSLIEGDAIELTDQLRELAKNENLRDVDIARDLGLNRSSVNRWLNGHTLPRRQGTIDKVRNYIINYKGSGN